MIIFSEDISEDDRKKLESMGHVVIAVNPSNVTAIDDGGDVSAALDAMRNALLDSRKALAACADSLGGSYREHIQTALNNRTK